MTQKIRAILIGVTRSGCSRRMVPVIAANPLSHMPKLATYRSSRFKTVLVLAGSMLLACASYFMIPERPLVGWIGTVLFAGFALLVLVTLLTGGMTLTLGHKGFELASWTQRKRVRWDEIEQLQIGEIRKSRMIAVRYLPASGKSGMSRAVTGADLVIGAQFGAPLQQICDAMNEYRARFLASNPGTTSTPAALAAGADLVAVETARASGRPARIVLMAFGAALLVLVANVLLRLVLDLQGTWITLAISFGVAMLVLAWFFKILQRPPTARERLAFLGLYSALITLPYLGLFLIGSANHGFNLAAFVVLVLHSIAYPAAAQMLLAEKRFEGLQPKRA